MTALDIELIIKSSPVFYHNGYFEVWGIIERFHFEPVNNNNPYRPDEMVFPNPLEIKPLGRRDFGHLSINPASYN